VTKFRSTEYEWVDINDLSKDRLVFMLRKIGHKYDNSSIKRLTPDVLINEIDKEWKSLEMYYTKVRNASAVV